MAEMTSTTDDGEGPGLRRHDWPVLEAAFAAASMGIWECSLPGEVVVWSDGVFDLFELPKGMTPDRDTVLQYYEPETRRELIELRSEAIRAQSGFELDAKITTAQGNSRWIRITASVESRDGVPFRIFGVKRDITNERNLLDRALHLAEHDVLTGLKNRVAFDERLVALETSAPAPQCLTALLLFDLDGFKDVNDSFGHAAGDEVLRAVGRRLRKACIAEGFVARIGGDEFALLVDGSAETAERLASGIVEEVSKPIKVAGREFRIGVSAGIARMRPHEAASALYHRADTALYLAKAAGRGTYRVCQAG